jgi:hypothetical protein
MIEVDKDLKDFGAKLKKAKKIKEVKEEPKEVEIEVEEELSDEQITKDLTEEEVVKQKTVQGKKYDEVIDTMPELKQDLDYVLIINKLKKGKTITKKEEEFKQVYESAKQKEQETLEQQEKQFEKEQIEQKFLQDKINKEYEKFKVLHPDRIESIDTTKSFSMNGSENFLKVALMFLKLKKHKKKGGKIFVKVARPKKVSIEWTTKDLKYVEFWGKNDRGEAVKEVTRVNEYQYSFNGTSIPVVFAIQGVPIAYDFYSGMKKDLSSEFVSGLVMEAYNVGFKDGVVMTDKSKKPNPLEGILMYLPIIIVIMCIAMIYFLYSMYEDQTKMLDMISALKSAAQTGAIVVGP